MGRSIARAVVSGLAATLAALSASAALAAPRANLDLPSQDLATALRKIATSLHVELLFDAAKMTGRRSAEVHSAANADEALRQVLLGTGFVPHQGDFGEILILPALAPSPEPIADKPTAVAEVLVIGSRSLNTAIRRTENDTQPYAVFSSQDLAKAQSQTLEDFLRTRDPDDAQAGTLAQAPVANGGAVRSRISLAGLGDAQTLVLVDGRRIPSVPGQDIFQQGDLNGIPLAAIDRVETLTSTAGGIFGPGATGGVVNVILKRNYSGGQIGVSGGFTSRLDAPHWRIDGSVGHTFGDGNTRVMLAFSRAEDSGLTQGQREIAARARQAMFDRGLTSLPISASLNVVPYGDVLGPGAALEYDRTFKPFGLPLNAGGLSALQRNAGRFDLSLSPDGQGAMQSLLSRTQTSALVFNLRQVVNPKIDAFVDALYFEDKGWAIGPRTRPSITELSAGQDNNPFNGVMVSFPTPGLAATSNDISRSLRLTAGAIARLAKGWSGEIDLTYGFASDDARIANLTDTPSTVGAFPLFDDGRSVGRLYAALPDTVERQTSYLTDINLRLSGPLLTLPAGAVTMTVLGEFRREYQPQAYALSVVDGTVEPYPIGHQAQTVSSAYAEVRAPLFDRQAVAPLRGLELQLAGRADIESVTAPADLGTYSDLHRTSGVPIEGHANTFALTAGLRAFPADWLMLRASVATGYLPPSPDQLITGTQSTPAGAVGYGFDPKRGGENIGATVPFTFQWHGSPTLRPEQARTISVGFVVTPPWAGGARLSVDYTRIDKSREITGFDDVDFQFFLDHEAQFPGRVTRLPLTATDAAAGFTVGPVVDIDTTPLSIGQSIVQTVDFNAAYDRATDWGHFHVYARATWQPDYRRKSDPRYGFSQIAGHIDGPLPLRGNLGVDWSRGRWSAGLNVQVYSGYDVTYGERSAVVLDKNYFIIQARGTVYGQNNLNVLGQGGPHIPWQSYLDLELAYDQPLANHPAGLQSIEYRIGVRNLLDTTPPILAIDPTAPDAGQALFYSPYGDPRGRRIEMAIIGRF